MRQQDEFDHSTLSWVKKELDETLKQSAQALEAYTEDTSDTTQLRFCATYLHQVQGILQMLELYGASMLAEEMEQVSRSILDGKVSRPEEGYEVLMRAILSLSDYLDKIQGGHKDIPLLILPLLNDLRALRGENLLTENAMFTPDMSVTEDTPRLVTDTAEQVDVSAEAKKLRHQYQLGLLSLLRNNKPEQGVERMTTVMGKLLEGSSNEEVASLFWITKALLEAIKLDAVDASTAVKMLLGQIDRQVRQLSDQGEGEFAQHLPQDLLRNLLYYVGRAEPASDTIKSVQERYQLSEYLPNEKELEKAKKGMAGPTSDMLATVSNAIKEDLTTVKDGLDVFVRGGAKDTEKLEDLSGTLNRVGDTLGMLGLGDPRRVIKEQASALDAVRGGSAEATDKMFMDLANALLYAESSVEGLLGHKPSEEVEEEGEVDSQKVLLDHELNQVFDITVREAIANLAAVKESILAYLENKDFDTIAQVADLYGQVRGAMSVLSLDRAANIVAAAAEFMDREIVGPQKHPENEQLETYAEAISSVEYYLEAELERRGHRGAILDMAENSLASLGYQPEEVAEAETPVEEPADSVDLSIEIDVPEIEEGAEEEVSLEAPELEIASEEPVAETQPEPIEEPEPVVEAPKKKFSQSAAPNVNAPVLSEDSDPEILEIFLEEAEELLETLNEQFPKWRANTDDQEPLTVTRRMFHTFKGSGRLAGVLQVGELSWAVENLLNRVLENTIPSDATALAIVGDTIDLLPEMVEEAKGGPKPSSDPVALMMRAYQLVEPDFVFDVETAEEASAPEETPVEEAPVEELVAEAPAEEIVAEAPVEEEITLEAPEESSEAPLEEAVVEADQAPETAEASEGLDGVEFSFDSDAFAEEEAAEELVAEQETPEEPEQEQTEAAAEELAEEAIAEAPAEDISVDFSMEGEDQGGMDPVLYDIFSKETRDHLATVADFVEKAKASDEPAKVNIDLVRALHTLGGSARMAGVENIADLGKTLEHFIEAVLAVELPLNEEHIVAIDEGSNAIESMLAALGDTSLDAPDASELIEFIQQLRSAVPEPEGDSQVPSIEQLAAAAVEDDHDEEPETPVEEALEVPVQEESVQEAPAEAAAIEEAAEPLKLSELEDVDQDLVDIFLEEADDILNFIESSINRWEENPEDENVVKELHRSLHTLKGGARMAGFSGVAAISHVLESLSDEMEQGKVAADDAAYTVMHDSLDELMRLNDLAKKGLVGQPSAGLMQAIAEVRGVAPEASGLTPSANAVAETVMADMPEADDELVEVFLEEAVEILASTEKTLVSWIEQPDNEDLIVELQRALHTLKGGARMAGFKEIADLSHHVESVLTDIVDKKLEAKAELFDILEVVNDALIDMRDKAEAKEPAEARQDLIDRLIAFREGKEAAEAAPVPKIDVAEPAAPKVEKTPEEKKSVTEVTPSKVEKKAEPKKKSEEKSDAAAEIIRVRADLLDNLVNFAGEVSIYRARLDQNVGTMRFNLDEFRSTVERLRDQLRTLEIETEAQILFRYEKEHEDGEVPEDEDSEDFDPLELDRFSRMQELSRALAESVNDLSSLQDILDHLSRETETLLLQQSRVNTELTEGLMRTRMVPFSNLVPRMRRIVRQTSSELGKKGQLKVFGAEGEMDRTVLERVIAPLEHMLRNALAHGIEDPEKRKAAGKPEAGTINIGVSREGGEVVLEVTDDGQGINIEAIKKKAREKGWLQDEMMLSDNEIMQFILESGFSTAEAVTQIAGRGVGMDVVNAEIKQLGGNLHIDSESGVGSKFTIRLPFTLAINRALLVGAGDEVYAIPLSSIEGIVRMAHEELSVCYEDGGEPFYDYAGQRYQLRNLGQVLGLGDPILPGAGKRAPVVLVQTGDHRIALQVDHLMGNREIVMKSVGSQLSTVPGISGATILADGRVVLILEVAAFARTTTLAGEEDLAAATDEVVPVPTNIRRKHLIMVVDDSITMRKVSTRLLERNGMDVITAKDGVDAVAVLQENMPDAMLLDIEMPRMDGYELATHMKNDDRLKNIPIIMITSRTGEKHRQRAMDIGVNRYLGKPYQEADLLENLGDLLGARNEPA